MSNTFSQIYIQLVFAVKGRQSLIQLNWKEELYKYICGIVNNKHQKIYAIGGMPDHIHILVSIRPNVSLSELVRDIKAHSSKWINTKKVVPGKFQWQEGFGAFSYSHSQLDAVINYINTQAHHHQKKTFKEEYLDFLEKFKVEFDERFLFEWIG